MNRSITRSIFTIFSSKFGVLFFTIVTTPILVRLLGSDGYGDYSFMISTLQWLLIFVYAGSFNGIRKYISEDRSVENWADSVYGFYGKVAFGFAALTVVAIIVFAESDHIISTLGSEFALYFYIVVLMIPFRVLFRTSRSTLMGFGLERYSEPLRVVDRAIFAAFVVIFFQLGWDVAAVLAGRTIAYIIVALISFVIVSRYINPISLVTRSPASLPRKQLLTYSISTTILVFLMVSLYQLDIILLRTMVGSTETGYYRAALVVAEFLWFAPTAVQIALLHSTSQLWVEENYEQLTNISAQITRYTLLLSLLLVLGVAGLARPLLTTYFGPGFEAAVIPLLLLLPGALGFAVARPMFAINQAQENLRILIFVTTLAALINFALNITLIPLYGMNGAAVATSTAYASMFILHTWSAQQLGYNPVADIRIGRITLTATISGIPIIYLPKYISSDAISLLIVPVIGFVLYSILSYKTGSIDESEIRSLVLRGSISIDRLFN